MIYAGIDVNIITHEKAEAAGPEAFGLWCWAMCWAQVHESDGRVPRLLALRALGGKRNAALAQRLVDVGLWVANADGSWSIHNYAKKNQTSEEIQRRKAGAKARKDAYLERQRLEKERSGNASRTRSGTQMERVAERPLSPSPPPEPTPPPSVVEIAPAPPPRPRPVAVESVSEPILEAPALTPALRAMVAQVAEPAGVTLDGDHEWLTYVAHCGREARAVSPSGWKYWLCNAAKFAKRDRVRDSARGAAMGARHIVQSGDNRAWKLPEGLE